MAGVLPCHLLRRTSAVEDHEDHGEPQRVSSASDAVMTARGLSHDDVDRRLTISPQTTPIARSFVAVTSPACCQSASAMHARVAHLQTYAGRQGLPPCPEPGNAAAGAGQIRHTGG